MAPLLDSLWQFLFKFPARIYEQGTFVWQRAGLLPIILGAGLALAALTLWAYSRGGRTRPVDRAVLATARILAIALLGACLLRPGLLLSVSAPQQNVLGILLDDSRSMLIQDADSVTRLDRIRGIFGDSTGDLISRLSEKFVLRFYRFSETLERIDAPASLRGTGGRTDLATALADARRDFTGVPLAGLIVATDGADNGGQSLNDALLTLKAAKVPVYPVGVGSERFERDVAIDRVELPRTSLKGAVLVGAVAIRAHGLAGETLSLVVEDGNQIVTSKDVTVPRGTEVITVPVRIPPLEAGTREVRVSVKPVRGEAVSQNNSRSSRVRVRDRREKILYLEGLVRPEFAFLRRAAATDSNLQVVGLQRTSKGKFLRLGVDDSLELVGGFPETRAELFRYRALVLGSIEASFFTADQLRMIAEFVSDRGGGLLALGGRASFGEGAFEGTAVADALPVTFANRVADSAEPAVELAIKPTPAGLGNAALMLAATEDGNSAKWDSLPPLTSVNRLAGLKPGATTLLEGRAGSADPVPILASHRFGRGRALAFTVQDSWLWQMHAAISVEDLTHETLWRQLLRWVLEDVPDQAELTFTPEHPVPGERVTVRAEIADSAFARINDAQVSAEVAGPDGRTQTVPLDWSLGQDGLYQGSFVAAAEGDYLLTLSAAMGRDTLRLPTETIEVADRGADFINAERRTPVLQRIAQETGGRFYTPETVASLPDDVVYTESGVTTRETKDLWDMPAIFFVIVASLAFEWVYRRRRGLV
ncbi:MAG: glutamine amidotransferase [Gemmatimonadales bacterium]